MKKIFFAITTFLAINFSIVSAGVLEIGFEGGLATPNDKMNDIYNSNTLKLDQDAVANLVNKGLKAGYHLGLLMQMPLNDYFSFAGHIGFNSFPESEILVQDPNTGDTLATLKTNTRIVPIAAGIKFYPFKFFLNPYATGEISYNYMSTSVSGPNNIPFSNSPSDSRFGYGIGAGVELDVKLLSFYLEGKFNQTNLIGKEAKEDDKNYFTLTLGILF
ncbi:MAG: hypothetical protein A2X64_05500 [Ignavibacteria bacterium GWF2_33_9]|nr:MAG: hypothetical protein A2X64_05500 [Ignavibacteria bacterium GWF2_33_9]